MSYFVRTISEVEDTDKVWLARGKLVEERNAQPYAHPSAARLAIEQMVEKHVKQGTPVLDYVMLKEKDAPLPDVSQARAALAKPEPNIVAVAGQPELRIIRYGGLWEIVQVIARDKTLVEARNTATLVEA